jgi:Protein of unknown function (DUF2752)
VRAESPSVPPKIAVSSSPAFFVVIVLALAALGSGAMLFFFDPAKHGFYPICLFHSLTGLNCPGCGGTRAAYQLLHGHLLRALHDNALFVLALAVLAIWSVRLMVQKMRNQPVRFEVPARAWGWFLGGALLFTVLRNIPAFAWLSP